jgi:cytochrome c oxidase assembly protein subunit 15
VYLMIVVGGITRLTQSGLSMVEWAPIMGSLPPIGDAAWIDVFAKYQSSPEYQKVNFGMTLAEFKGIFWWEYGHRLLGRTIGIIYLLPLLFFLFKGMVPNTWRLRLLTLFLLGGLQGLLGWYMVMSGLVDVPHVSQYRLTAHLGLAVIIYICMLWFALEMLRGEQRRHPANRAYPILAFSLVMLVFIMMLSGGFVAGTKAGFIINTFPKMNGEWLPLGVFALSPGWRNLFENAVTIQFIHRWLALVVLLLSLIVVSSARKQAFKTGVAWVLIAVIVQVSLGISALLLVVPVALGAAHQAGAVALLSSSLWVAHLSSRIGRKD